MGDLLELVLGVGISPSPTIIVSPLVKSSRNEAVSISPRTGDKQSGYSITAEIAVPNGTACVEHQPLTMQFGNKEAPLFEGKKIEGKRGTAEEVSFFLSFLVLR
jgi:hypothetical protein